MAKREDQEKDERIKKLEEAIERFREVFDTQGQRTSKTLASYAESLKLADERTRTVTAQLERLGTVLSKGDQEELVNKSKEYIKTINVTTKKFTDSEISAIHDMESLALAIKDLEDEYKDTTTLHGKHADKYSKLQERLQRTGMSQVQKEVLLDVGREKYLRAQAKEIKGSENHYDVIAQLVPQLKAHIDQTERSVGAMSRMRVGVDKVTSSLASSAKGFFSLDNAAAHLKKALTTTYDEMNRLSSQGLLGAFTQIQVVSKTLYVSTEELQKSIMDNRQFINSKFGGGAKGVEQFTDEVKSIQKELLFLGKNSGTYALQLEGLANQTGFANEDQADYNKNLDQTVKHFKYMNKMYGSSAEEYKDLMLSQQRETNVMSRLTTMHGKELGNYQEELRVRTENLKQLGYSNDQIKEFNSKLEAIYDPNKDTYQQQSTENVYIKGAIDELGHALHSLKGASKNADPTIRAEQNKTVDDAITSYDSNKSFLKEAQDRRRDMAPQDYSEWLLQNKDKQMSSSSSLSMANNIVTNRLPAQAKTTLGQFKESSGALGQYLFGDHSPGQTTLTNTFEGRNNPKQTDQKSVEDKNTDLQGEHSAYAIALRTQTFAIEGIKKALDSPLGELAQSALAAAGALAGIGKLAGLAKGGASVAQVAGVTSTAAAGGAAAAKVAGSAGAAVTGAEAAGTAAGTVASGVSKIGMLKGLGTGIAGLGLQYGGDALRDHSEKGGIGQATGMIGSVGGSALNGMATGAMLGSFVGPGGTVAGGLIGGAIGTGLGVYNNLDSAKQFDAARASKKSSGGASGDWTSPTTAQQPKVNNDSSSQSGPNRAQPLLDLIGKTEGTDKGRGYNETLGYGAYTGGDVDLENMTISDVFKLQEKMLNNPANKMNSSAVGRYQIVKKTLIPLVKQLGMDPNTTKFDKETQDKLATELLRQRGLNKVINGEMDFASFSNNISKEWASLPNSNGVGSYSGQGIGGSNSEVLAATNATINGTGYTPTAPTGNQSNPSMADNSPTAKQSSGMYRRNTSMSSNGTPSINPILVQLDDISISKMKGVYSPDQTTPISTPTSSASNVNVKTDSPVAQSMTGKTADQVFNASLNGMTSVQPWTTAQTNGTQVQPVNQIAQPTSNAQVQAIDPNLLKPQNNQATTPLQTTDTLNNNPIQSTTDQLAELKKHTDLLSTLVTNSATTSSSFGSNSQQDRGTVLNGTY
jgi:muramidase (phage lysozyme)